MEAKGSQSSQKLLVGAKLRSDGSLDTSRAMHVLSPLVDERQGDESKNLFIPNNWTLLYHGTNLLKPHWQGRDQTLEEDQLTIEGRGLSAISDEDRIRDTSQGNYDTTKGYASIAAGESAGQPVEIRVIFPIFNSRRVGTEEIVAEYASRYGSERAQTVLERSDVVYWKNMLGGSHPVLPRGMVLDRISGQMEDGKRIVIYVPHELRDIYEADVERELVGIRQPSTE